MTSSAVTIGSWPVAVVPLGEGRVIGVYSSPGAFVSGDTGGAEHEVVARLIQNPEQVVMADEFLAQFYGG